MSHKRRRRRRPAGDAPARVVQARGQSGAGHVVTPPIPAEPPPAPRAAPPARIEVPHGLPVSDQEMRRLKERARQRDEEQPDDAQADAVEDTGED